MATEFLSSGCFALVLWFGASGAVAETPAARASTAPDNPVPQAENRAPAAPSAAAVNDEQCRLATRQSEGVASCLSSSDADHDGVSDGQDQCPDTTPGVAVDSSGCARVGPDG